MHNKCFWALQMFGKVKYQEEFFFPFSYKTYVFENNNRFFIMSQVSHTWMLYDLCSNHSMTASELVWSNFKSWQRSSIRGRLLMTARFAPALFSFKWVNCQWNMLIKFSIALINFSHCNNKSVQWVDICACIRN